MPLKVITCVGTRPEIIKLSRTIVEMEKYMDHVLVHTGQNYDYELNEIFFKDLGLKKPDYFLNAAEGTPCQTIGKVIASFDDVLDQEKPDAVLLYGDTNSCLSIIAAKRRKIPVFHMEAGNRCFDQRVPEEINRKVVDHLSDINMVHSEHARRYLISEGIPPETVIKVGSPMVEILQHYKERIDTSDALTRLELKAKDFFLVSTHREENVDSPQNFKDLLESLNTMATKFEKRVIVSTHPRTRKKLEQIKDVEFHQKIEFLKPLGFFDYCHLQQNAFCVLSDSGTLTEESSILGFPSVMIRQAHERPEGMDAGVAIMSGLNSDRILDSIQMAVAHGGPVRKISDYEEGPLSLQVVRIIQSYRDYIKRTVWREI
jgi:UDP-N-acetylglucosamine 2-epimerase